MGLVGRIQVQRQPVHQLVQRVVIHQPAQTLDDGIGHHVLACDGRQRIAGDGLGIPGWHQRRLHHRQVQHVLVQLEVVLQVALLASLLDLVERRLGDVDVAALDQLGHLAVEEREQQRADVAAVHVRVGHDDDAVIAQLLDLEVVGPQTGADARAQHGDQRGHLLGGQQLVKAGLLDVEHLAAQRQDGLELAVAPLLGRTAGRVTLHDEEFALRRIAFLAVGQLAGQADAVQHALAARHVARLAGRLAGPRRLDDLAADDLGVVGLFQQVGFQPACDHVLDGRPHLAGDQLVLGLRRELGLGHLHRQHAGQALAHVVARGVDLGLAGDLVLFDVLVDDPRHGRAQAGEVRAAVTLRNVVGEAQHLLVVAVVPLQRGLHRHPILLAPDVEDVGVQHVLGAVDVLDKARDAAREREILFLVVAQVLQADAHAIVEERQLAQALGERLVVVLDLGEDRVVGQEVHLGATPGGVAQHLDGRDGHAVLFLDDAVLGNPALELDEMRLAVAIDGELEPARQRVDARHPHPVQAARDLVAVLVELAAGMQLGHHDLGRTALGIVLVVPLHIGGNAPAVVTHRDRLVGVNRHQDLVAVAGQRLVHRVVDRLEHQVMQTGAVGCIADVHARALSHRFQPLQDLDRGGVVPGPVALGLAPGRLFRVHRIGIHRVRHESSMKA